MRNAIQPRLIRLRDAPGFFGMDKNRFNAEIRPKLTEIRIGRQGRAFDRLEMEAAADQYKRLNGYRPTADLTDGAVQALPQSTTQAQRRLSPSRRDQSFARALRLVHVRPSPPSVQTWRPVDTSATLEKAVGLSDDINGDGRPAAQRRKPWDNDESPAS